MISLPQFCQDFARGIRLADSRRPQHGQYQPGIGPHTEKDTVRLALEELSRVSPETYADKYSLEVPYPNQRRNKCDLCLGKSPDWDLAVEVKMLRLMGDNGKPNDNILMHILSPYPAHRSAVTDCQKLLASGLSGQKAIVIYGYDYPDWPMDPAIDAFEALASRLVTLGRRCEADIKDLIHPVHQQGRLFGWELS